jgi:hypothetical protein
MEEPRKKLYLARLFSLLRMLDSSQRPGYGRCGLPLLRDSSHPKLAIYARADDRTGHPYFLDRSAGRATPKGCISLIRASLVVPDHQVLRSLVSSGRSASIAGLYETPEPLRRTPTRAKFLTFSNRAVGNGREWTVPAGSRSGEKPYRITRFGSGRDSPEPPNSGSNPAGATKIAFILQGFPRYFQAPCNKCATAAPFSLLADEPPRRHPPRRRLAPRTRANSAARKALAEQAAPGDDPHNSGEANRKHGAANAEHHRRNHEGRASTPKAGATMRGSSARS